MFNKLGTIHSLVKGIQVCSNGLRPFPREDNYEIAKIHRQNKKKIFSRTAGPISIRFGTEHPWLKENQVRSNYEPFNSHKVNNGLFLLLINIMMIVCVY